MGGERERRGAALAWCVLQQLFFRHAKGADPMSPTTNSAVQIPKTALQAAAQPAGNGDDPPCKESWRTVSAVPVSLPAPFLRALC